MFPLRVVPGRIQIGDAAPALARFVRASNLAPTPADSAPMKTATAAAVYQNVEFT